jgi:hypothetical protein
MWRRVFKFNVLFSLRRPPMKWTKNLSHHGRLLLAATIAGLALLGLPAVAVAQRNPNPGIAPPTSQPYGMTYGEWAAAWWQWAMGIPAAENPVLDETGEFAHVDQAGPVWFLGGSLFGGEIERTFTVPAGKALYVPLSGFVYWAPEDLPLAISIAESLGIDPDDLTDEELLRLAAVFSLAELSELTLTIDGVEIQVLERYFATSPGFTVDDDDLLDDFGFDPDGHELFVAASYSVILRPLAVGEHTIRVTAVIDDSPLGGFVNDVTYHITVAAGKR